MSDISNPTTAEFIGKFRGELIDQGFDHDQAFVLSRDMLGKFNSLDVNADTSSDRCPVLSCPEQFHAKPRVGVVFG